MARTYVAPEKQDAAVQRGCEQGVAVNGEDVGPAGLQHLAAVQRQPWFVAAGAPPEAHVHMLFTEFRYVLPGT